MKCFRVKGTGKAGGGNKWKDRREKWREEKIDGTILSPSLYYPICVYTHTHVTQQEVSTTMYRQLRHFPHVFCFLSVLVLVGSFSNISFLLSGPLCGPARSRKHRYTIKQNSSQETHPLLEQKVRHCARPTFTFLAQRFWLLWSEMW